MKKIMQICLVGIGFLTAVCCFAEDFDEKKAAIANELNAERRVAVSALAEALKPLYDEAKDAADIDQVLEIRKIQKQIDAEDFDINYPAPTYKKLHDAISKYKKETESYELNFLEEVMLVTGEEIKALKQNITNLIEDDNLRLAKLLGNKRKKLEEDVEKYKARYSMLQGAGKSVTTQKPERPRGVVHRGIPDHVQQRMLAMRSRHSNIECKLLLECEGNNTARYTTRFFHGTRQVRSNPGVLSNGRAVVYGPIPYFDRVEIDLMNDHRRFDAGNTFGPVNIALTLNGEDYSQGKRISVRSKLGSRELSWAKPFKEQEFPYFSDGRIGIILELLNYAKKENFGREEHLAWVSPEEYGASKNNKISTEGRRVGPPTHDVKEVQDALVLIKTNSGSGSGFLGEVDGKTYLFTNQHVIQSAKSLKFTTPNGIHLKPRIIETALDEDIAKITVALPEGSPKPLKISTRTPSLGDAITVMGNSQGGGVATRLTGKVQGVGADRLEVSATFVPGNSGSPILDSNAEVVGIATYVQRDERKNWTNADTRFTETRRFGLRFHKDIKWIKVQPRNYFKQGQLLSDAQLYITELLKIFPQLTYYYWERGGRTKVFIDGKYDGQSSRYHDQTFPNKLKSIYRNFGKEERVRTSQTNVDRAYMVLKNEMVGELTHTSKKLKSMRWRNRYLQNEAKEMASYLDDLSEDIDSVLNPIRKN